MPDRSTPFSGSVDDEVSRSKTSTDLIKVETVDLVPIHFSLLYTGTCTGVVVVTTSRNLSKSKQVSLFYHYNYNDRREKLVLILTGFLM